MSQMFFGEEIAFDEIIEVLKQIMKEKRKL